MDRIPESWVSSPLTADDKKTRHGREGAKFHPNSSKNCIKPYHRIMITATLVVAEVECLKSLKTLSFIPFLHFFVQHKGRCVICTVISSSPQEILVIFSLFYWRINKLIWEKTASVVFHHWMLSSGSSLSLRPWTGLFWCTCSLKIQGLILKWYLTQTLYWKYLSLWFGSKRCAVALSDGSLEVAPVRPTGSSVCCCSDEGAGCDSHAHRLQNNWDIAQCIFLVWNGSMLFVWQQWTITAHSAPVTSPNLSRNTSKNTLFFLVFQSKRPHFSSPAF